MYEKLVKETVDKVIEIFINSDIHTLPSEEEIRDEFDIIGKIHVTKEIIEDVEYSIATYLDQKCPKYSQYKEGHTWTAIRRFNMREKQCLSL